MAERMLAKKYLRRLEEARPPREGTIGRILDVPKTESECVQRLIDEHHRMWTELHGATPTSWFGRLLWKLFGRWL